MYKCRYAVECEDECGVYYVCGMYEEECVAKCSDFCSYDDYYDNKADYDYDTYQDSLDF